MNITKENSEAIRAISFLCALLVVPIHCTSATTLAMSGEVSAPRWAVILQLLGADTISRLAVPRFFVVSGLGVSLLAGWALKRFVNPLYRTLCGGAGVRRFVQG